MIHEVDESIRNLIRLDTLTGTEVDVVFDAPTKDWSSRRNAPTVDVYLYDIREDMRRREVGRFDQRDGDGHVSERRQPPRWYKLSYLVTAWTQRPEDEHRLLAAMMRRFLLEDRLPDAVLTGSLADLGYPIPYTCALPPPEDRALSDVWSALGGELKPSLDLVVIAPFDLQREIEVGPPVIEGPQLSVTPSVAGPASKRGRAKRGAKASGQDAAAQDAAAADPSAQDASEAGARSPEGASDRPPRRYSTEERTGSRHGKPGRRFFITEMPT